MPGLFEKGWFHERNDQWPGQAMSLKVQGKKLLEKRTKFQDLVVFDTETWGRCMLLDGVIQITNRDECSYQEMLAHTPMHCHKKPQRVLIIGGGDGGMLREVCKHDSVKYVKMVDIDGDVIEACKKYFPTVACAFEDPRADVEVGDGVKFVADHQGEGFDVIIVDSSDPVGPAEGLFSAEFYKSIQKILKPDGIIGAQGECLWLHQDMILDMLATHSQPFALAQYASIQVPTYPCGQIGIFLARNHGALGNTTMAEPQLIDANLKNMSYYSTDMHRAAFALPVKLANKVEELGRLHKAVRTETPFSNQKDREREQAAILAKGTKRNVGKSNSKEKLDKSNSKDKLERKNSPTDCSPPPVHDPLSRELSASSSVIETSEKPKGLDANDEVINAAKRPRRGGQAQ